MPLQHLAEAFVTSTTLCTHGPLSTALSLTALSLTKAPFGDSILYYMNEMYLQHALTCAAQQRY